MIIPIVNVGANLLHVKRRRDHWDKQQKEAREMREREHLENEKKVERQPAVSNFYSGN